MFLCNIYFSNSGNHNDLKCFKSYRSALQQAWKTRQRNSLIEAMMSFHFGWLAVVCSEVKCTTLARAASFNGLESEDLY